MLNITCKKLFLKKSLITILLTTIVVNIGCKEQISEEKKIIIDDDDKIGIVVNKNSSVRIQPFLYSTKIAQLNRNARVEIVSQSQEQSRVGQAKGYWYRVKLENGLIGWTFGKNMKLFSKNDQGAIEDLENELKESEMKKIVQRLKGRWWSINSRGEFTSHAIAFFENMDYIATHKNGPQKKGTFSIDANKSQIIFSKGTTLGKEFNFFERGQELGIEFKKKKYSIGFKKISADPKETTDEK